MYLGIDLGTSNSVVAGLSDGKLRIYRTADGGEVLPSVIYFDKRGHRLYGRRAYDMGITQPENVASGFKRLMGTSTPIQIPGVELTLSAEECSAEIIRQLLAQAATETGTDQFAGAVITIPAAFNQMQSEATLRAAQMAGLNRVALLQEPVAAAMAAMAGAKKSGQFLIYDLGGGTFDLALAQALSGEVNIIAHQGINMLGGRDFDRMMVNEVVRPWLVANFDLPENFQRVAAYRKLIRAAQLACEKAKIELSARDQAPIFASDEDLRLTDESGKDIYLDIPVTRKQFEDIIRETVMDTIELIRDLLKEQGYSHEDIDRIVFIGGPSKTPIIRQMVSQELGIPTDLKIDPMTAVAVGAAYYCESRDWGQPAISTGARQAAETSTPPASAPASVPAAIPQTTASVTSAATGKTTEHKTTPAEDTVTASKRKPQQAKKTAQAMGGGAGFTFEYPARQVGEEAVISLRVPSPLAGHTIEVENAAGWTSEKQPMNDGLRIRAPLAAEGDNRFRLTVLNADGQVVPQGSHILVITRTVATTAGIPASQTIAVKVLDNPEARENSLAPLLEKGTLLPAAGKARYRAARDLRAGESGHVSFELFQLEYPDKTELNLCVGVFRIGGEDLPDDYVMRSGDPIVFNWKMSDSGILQASVTLPPPGGQANAEQADTPIELKAPRFYSPQAGQVSFDPEGGYRFANALLKQGEDELGDLASALGPEAERELAVLRQRLSDQRDSLLENPDDPEILRRVSEETRFIRQDIARFVRKYRPAVLQRRVGKLQAIFNRIARPHAEEAELARFTTHVAAIQGAIEDGEDETLSDAERHLQDVRDLFFHAAWRDQNYVRGWFERLKDEPYLYPDQDEFEAMVADGEALTHNKDWPGLSRLVRRMLESRVALSANDMAAELATIIRD